jgi:hypothetical protein
MSDNEMKEFLKDVVGCVSATHFEQHSIWLHNKELQETPYEWIEKTMGLFVEVGKFGGKPVCLSLSTAVVRGQKILFYDATSLVVHWDMIEKWLKENLPVTAFEDNDPRRCLNKTDAMNFHNIFRYDHVA